MNISILNTYGIDLQEWKTLQDELLSILKRDYGFALNEDDCSHKLQEVLAEDDINAITLRLFEQNQGAALNQACAQELGIATPYHVSILLGEFMLVGDGECPYCGSNYVNDVEGYKDYDYNSETRRGEAYYVPPTKVCQQCQYEWNTEA